MKKTKIIIPALGMLLLSTAASVTGTVAWFSMNSFVNATQMNIQARAEEGIVISNQDKSTWTDTASAKHTSAIPVYPTSTQTGAKWFHSSSNNAASATSNGTYTELDLALQDTTLNPGTGAGYINKNATEGYQVPTQNDAGDAAYYYKNSFFIKSSSAEAITKPFYVNKVNASAPTTSNSALLNEALRVLVVVGSDSAVFAPFKTDATTPTLESKSYTVCTAVDNEGVATTGSVTTHLSPAKNIQLNSALQIPGNNASSNPLRIDIYLYYEGEDEQCFSNNLVANLDTLTVSVKFGTQVDSSL